MTKAPSGRPTAFAFRPNEIEQLNVHAAVFRPAGCAELCPRRSRPKSW